MKYLLIILFVLISILGFSQGAGIRYVDSIPTNSPNTDIRQSVMVYNRADSTYYRWENGMWKDMGIIRVVDSTEQILGGKYYLGEQIINKFTGATYVVQPDTITSYQTDSIAVIPVDTGYAVLQPRDGGYNIEWFGSIGDGSTDNDLQKAINYAKGEHAVFVPTGNFFTSTSLIIPDEGMKLIGISTSPDGVPSKITYTGSGNAIELDAGFTSGWNKIEIENIHFVGTSSATGGLILDAVGKSVYGANIKGVIFSDFDGAGVYAVELSSVYNVQFTDNCRWQNNTNDILATGVVQSILIDNAWLTNAADVSIHAENLGGRFTISNTIIDAAGLGFWQESVSNATSGVLITHSHFEDNDQNLNVDAGYFWLDNTILSNPQTTADNLADGVIAQLDNVHGNTTTPMVLGLGTTWTNLHGRYVLPTHNDASTISNPSTIIEINSSVPTDISGVNVGNADRFAGTMTLRFMDNNTTLQSTAGSNAQFYLEGDINWTPSTGDYIVFKKYKYVTGDRAYFIEIGRYTVSGERFYTSIVGGISTTSDLSFKTTTAAGITGADMHFLVGNNGATEAMTILNNGNVGFGDIAPGYKVDIVGTSGSQLRLSSVTTDAATKAGYLDVRPFNNSDRDLTLIYGTTTGSSSTVNIGGGTSLSNAATRIGFFLAGNTTTQTGTEKVRIDNEGLKVGTTDNGAFEFQVNGQSYFNTGNSFATITSGGIEYDASAVSGGGASLYLTSGTSGDGAIYITSDAADKDYEIIADNAGSQLTIGIPGQPAFVVEDKSLSVASINTIMRYEPSSTDNIVAGTGLDPYETLMRVQGSGGAVNITAVPQITDGYSNGQMLIIEGLSDTNTVTFDDGDGLQLAGGTSAVLGQGDILQLIYNSGRDVWIEISRSDN